MLFLQHSYHFRHILCTYYLSSWANAGFAVRKLCDCEIETDVITRLRAGVLFHRMISVSILFTFLEAEERGKSVNNSIFTLHTAVLQQSVLSKPWTGVFLTLEKHFSFSEQPSLDFLVKNAEHLSTNSSYFSFPLSWYSGRASFAKLIQSNLL